MLDSCRSHLRLLGLVLMGSPLDRIVPHAYQRIPWQSGGGVRVGGAQIVAIGSCAQCFGVRVLVS